MIRRIPACMSESASRSSSYISRSDKSCFGRNLFGPESPLWLATTFLNSSRAWLKSRWRNRTCLRYRVLRQRIFRLRWDGSPLSSWFLFPPVKFISSLFNAPPRFVRRTWSSSVLARWHASDVRRYLAARRRPRWKDCESRLENRAIVLGSWEITPESGAPRANGAFNFGWFTEDETEENVETPNEEKDKGGDEGEVLDEVR